MNQKAARAYHVQARSTDVFGRVLCSSGNHHYVVDGPVQNGCPGEAITPAEVFLGGVAACGVELVQVLARERQYPLTGVQVAISGTLDRSQPVRADVTVFNKVSLHFRLLGVSQDQGGELVKLFQGR